MLSAPMETEDKLVALACENCSTKLKSYLKYDFRYYRFKRFFYNDDSIAVLSSDQISGSSYLLPFVVMIEPG